MKWYKDIDHDVNWLPEKAQEQDVKSHVLNVRLNGTDWEYTVTLNFTKKTSEVSITEAGNWLCDRPKTEKFNHIITDEEAKSVSPYWKFASDDEIMNFCE